MAIKFGNIKHNTLLRLKEELDNTDFHSLGLDHINKLRNEVLIKVNAIEYEHKRENACPSCDGHGIVENSYMTCLSCNGAGKRNKS